MKLPGHKTSLPAPALSLPIPSPKTGPGVGAGAGWPGLLLSLTFVKPSASQWPKSVRKTDASRLKSIQFEVCLGWKLSNLTDNAAAVRPSPGAPDTLSTGWEGASRAYKAFGWVG